MRKDFDAVAKIAIVGDSTVGKTNLMMRYTNEAYVQTHVATIGIDFKVKIVSLEGYRIKMQIWDTAGQERFRNLTSSIYQGAQAVVVTYAINSRQSFDSIGKWLADIKSYAKNDVVLAIVGNKCDLEDQRTVEKEGGQSLASETGALFFQTSAKDNIQVDQLFSSIAVDIKKKNKQKDSNLDKQMERKSSKKQLTPLKSPTQIKNASNNEENGKFTLESKTVKSPLQSNKKKCC